MGGECAQRDASNCNTYNYGDALYWDGRYLQEVRPYDWYQRYSALRPFVNKHIPKASRLLMLGCGTAVMSEEMIKDEYEYIMNIDISSVAIYMMKKKNEDVPQLEYMQMDATDMSFFSDESFDSAIDKGTLDSLLCGYNAPTNAASMLGEVSRLLKPGGVYMLITYGDPTARMLHLNRPQYNWKITLYIIQKAWCQIKVLFGVLYGELFVIHDLLQIHDVEVLLCVSGSLHAYCYLKVTKQCPGSEIQKLMLTPCCNFDVAARPGFENPSTSSHKSILEPIPLTEDGLLPPGFTLEDPESHFIYVCEKGQAASLPTDL